VLELEKSGVTLVNRGSLRSVYNFEAELSKWYFYCVSAEETLTNYQYTVRFALQIISQTTVTNFLSTKSLIVCFVVEYC